MASSKVLNVVTNVAAIGFMGTAGVKIFHQNFPSPVIRVSFRVTVPANGIDQKSIPGVKPPEPKYPHYVIKAIVDKATAPVYIDKIQWKSGGHLVDSFNDLVDGSIVAVKASDGQALVSVSEVTDSREKSTTDDSPLCFLTCVEADSQKAFENKPLPNRTVIELVKVTPTASSAGDEKWYDKLSESLKESDAMVTIHYRHFQWFPKWLASSMTARLTLERNDRTKDKEKTYESKTRYPLEHHGDDIQPYPSYYTVVKEVLDPLR